MSLDPPKSDAELLALRDAKMAPPMGQPVRLGPDSPLRSAPPARRKQAKHKGPSEHDIQAALFAKINDPAEQRRRPALALVYAVPSGGLRSARTAGMLKASGVKPGVPDIDCPVGRGGYIGLRLEMKRPGGALMPAQVDWLAQLEREGHRVAVHETVDGAWAELLTYLDLSPTIPARPLTSQ